MGMGMPCSAIVGLLISFVGNCQCMSKTVFQLALYFKNQSEIVFISDNFPESIPDKFQDLFQFSFVQFEGESNSLDEKIFEKMARNYSQSVKIIAALPEVPETLSVVSQVSKSQVLKLNPSQASLIVLWPQEVLDELESNQTLDTYFKQENITGNFSVNREFFVVFNVRNSGTAKSQQYIHNLYYEAYWVNMEFVYRRLIVFNCKNCSSVQSSTSVRRRDLRGLPLRFEGVQDTEYNDDTLFKESSNGQVEFDRSFSVTVLELLRTAMNFTVIPVRKMEWTKLEDGTSLTPWDGAIRDVRAGVSDVGVSTFVMVPSRANLVSFLPATDEYVIAAFFRPPSLNAIRDIFMQPFEPNLWAAVMATWITLATSMILFTVIRKKVGAHENSSDPNATEPDFTQDSMIWALATACQQGWDEHPTALSLRAIFISGSFTAVIAYAGYSAAIVSTLSVRVDPIQNPAALIQSNLRIGMRDGFFQDIIPKSEEGAQKDVIDDLYRRLTKKETERRVNMSTGAALLRKYPYAYLSIREAFYDILKNASDKADVDICGIKELRILKQGFKGGMFTRMTFPYREFFKVVLIAIRERGILWRIRNEFTYTRRCLESSDNAGRALGANDVFTAFMILCGGYILSTFFLGIEKLIFMYKYSYAFVVTP